MDLLVFILGFSFSKFFDVFSFKKNSEHSGEPFFFFFFFFQVFFFFFFFLKKKKKKKYIALATLGEST